MLKLKIIDRYILRKFLGTFFYSILLLAVIIIIFDFSEKIDDFLKNKAPISAIIFQYYLNFIPSFINQFSALFTFISVVFFTSKMASNTEIIAILSNGVSFKRMLLPYLYGALILTFLSFALMNYIIPRTNRDLRTFEKKYILSAFRMKETNYHIQSDPGVFVYVESYNVQKNEGYWFTEERLGKNGLEYKFSANLVQWDSIKNLWKANNYCIRTLGKNGEIIRTGNELDTTFSVRPSDFIIDLEDVKVMTYSQLNTFIEREKERGNAAVKKFEVEKYKRIIFPFANIILTFIGVALSSRKVRGGIGLHLGFGIAISFTYILLLQITSVFAISGNLQPAIAMWIPNVLYALLALYLLSKAPK